MNVPTLTERITGSPQGMRIWQQERLILDVTERICELMSEKGISRAQLAEELGKAPSHISQLLNGEANMTLHTVADLFWACGRAAYVTDEPLATSATSAMTFTLLAQWHQLPSTMPPTVATLRFQDSLKESQGTGSSTYLTMRG
jgi:transcriptional regulator with XRE-family HTH domain